MLKLSTITSRRLQVNKSTVPHMESSSPSSTFWLCAKCRRSSSFCSAASRFANGVSQTIPSAFCQPAIVYDRLWHGMWIEEHSRLRGTLRGAWRISFGERQTRQRHVYFAGILRLREHMVLISFVSSSLSRCNTLQHHYEVQYNAQFISNTFLIITCLQVPSNSSDLKNK